MRIDFTPRRFMDPQVDLKATQELVETVAILKDAFASLGITIKQQLNDKLEDANDYTKDYIKGLKSDIGSLYASLGKNSSKLIDNQEKLNKGQLSSKEIQKQIVESKNKVLKIEADLERAFRENIINEQEQLKLYFQTQEIISEINSELKEQFEEAEKIEKVMGNLGNIVKGLNKIPIVGQFLQTEKIMSAMQQAAADTKDKTKVMLAGFKAIGSSIKEGMLDPLTIITFLLNQSLKANKQTVELGKALGTNSYEYRENLADIARFSSNINVTTANLVEAFNELTQATGFAYEFNADQLETQVKLTKQVGLQADEAAQIQRFSILTGKSSEATYNSFVRGLVATRNQLRVGINFKAVLAEAAKVSGQLAANLGFNPELIAKAVVTAKAFGMTLEQVAKAGESLLNFESSIENELKAELLTGKQLNLERARAAALAGDQVTLAEELAKNVGTAADFTKMNVLQQRALAESVGMTADELAETLRRREEAIASGKSLAQITEEEAKQALERQAVQDKFNAAILKLQDFFGNLVAGPLGEFLDILTKALPLITGIASVFGTIWITQKAITALEALKLGYTTGQRAMALGYNGILIARQALLSGELSKTIGIAVASIAGASAKTLGIAAGIALAAGAAAYAFLSSKKGDDIISEGGYGKRTLLAPEGAIKLNDKDTIIAGTNLMGGAKSEISSAQINPSANVTPEIQMPQIDLTPMITAINEVRTAVDRLYNKDTSINMDGKKVGTTLVQGSYKVA